MPIVSQRGLDERSSLLPPDILPLFDDAFVRSCDLIEEYTLRLAVGIAREAGLEAALASDAPVPQPAGWVVDLLRARGWTGPLPSLDPREIEAEQEAHDPRCLPSYRIAAAAAASYPAVLRGEITGTQALFAADRMEAWAAYFSNDNPLYAISNRIAAIAAARALPPDGAVLELGGGFGSGAEALVARLDRVAGYRFSEVSIPFLRKAQRRLQQAHPSVPWTFARLDIDRPFAEAGVEAGAYGLVHAVNVVHVARDLDATLGEIRRALAPGGALVMGECVRPFPGRPVYVELVFNLLETFHRPGGGFRTAEQWTADLERTGFAEVRVEPDVRVVREAYPSFVVAAIVATRG